MSWFKKIAQHYYNPDAPGEAEELPYEFQEDFQELPVVGPDNLGEYIEPEEDEEDEEIRVEPPHGYQEQETFLDEIPERHFIQDELSLIEDAIQTQQCLGFTYTSLKGKTTFRIAEPYGTFTAFGTGNLLVVTWDRVASGGGGIRAFIVDNIHPDIKIFNGDFYHFEQDKFVFNPY